MQLSETQALRIFNDHDVRVGDIDADLNHGRCNQQIKIAMAKCSHHLRFVIGLHPAVNKANTTMGQLLFQFLSPRFRSLSDTLIGFFDECTNPIGLTPLTELRIQTVCDLGGACLT